MMLENINTLPWVIIVRKLDGEPCTLADNLSVKCFDNNPRTSLVKFDIVARFTATWAVDVSQWLGADKSIVWSTCPRIKQLLKRYWIVQKHNFREVGGHMLTNRCMRNDTLNERIAEATRAGKRIRYVPAPMRRKIYLVIAKVLQKAL